MVDLSLIEAPPIKTAEPGSGPIETDMVIIGAGPAGLFAAFEAGLLDIKCHFVDALDKPGGQCAELYPEKPLFDIAGIPACTGQELTNSLLKQCSPFEPVFHLNQQAEKLERHEDKWQLTTSENTVLQAPCIVIAAGGGSFVPKKLTLPNAQDFENTSLYYAVRKMATFEGKNLVIAGGGDSALDWTLNLQPLAKRLTLIHRRDQFRAAPDSVAKMHKLVEQGKIDFVTGQITGLNGKDQQLHSISVKTAETEQNIECDALLAFYGLTMKLGPIADWGLNLSQNHIDVSNETFETSTAGIFAIGDICQYPGKLKLILSGFHEAALMAHTAHHYVHPDKKLVFRYTTSSKDLHQKLGVT